MLQQLLDSNKGMHLLEQDSYKEEFTLQLEKDTEVTCYNNNVDEFKVLGLPLL